MSAHLSMAADAGPSAGPYQPPPATATTDARAGDGATGAAGAAAQLEVARLRRAVRAHKEELREMQQEGGGDSQRRRELFQAYHALKATLARTEAVAGRLTPVASAGAGAAGVGPAAAASSAAAEGAGSSSSVSSPTLLPMGTDRSDSRAI